MKIARVRMPALFGQELIEVAAQDWHADLADSVRLRAVVDDHGRRAGDASLLERVLGGFVNLLANSGVDGHGAQFHHLWRGDDRGDGFVHLAVRFPLSLGLEEAVGYR